MHGNMAKEGCFAELRNELKILETEHTECLVKARSNKQIKSLRCRRYCIPDARLERSAYASVLRAFCAMTNHLSWLQVKLLTKWRNELRISHTEHKEVLVKVSSSEQVKSLRNFSLAIFSVLTKIDPAFDAHAVVHDKIGSTGQVSTSSTNCFSLAQQSPISERSMSSTRDIGILDSPNRAKCFEHHAVVSPKRLKSVNGRALTYLKCTPYKQLPVAVSVVIVRVVIL